MPQLQGADLLPGIAARKAGDGVNARYQPQELADLLNARRPDQPRIKLTGEQAEVIGSPLESSLVVAGAGSGKTLVMALRVVYLVANGLVQPEQILGLTFSRKAAGEMSERIRSVLAALPAELAGGKDGGQPVVSTYHAYAAGIVRSWGLQIGVDPRARILTDASKWEIAHQVVEAWDQDPPDRPSAGELTKTLVALAGQCSDNRITGGQFTQRVLGIIDEIRSKPEGRSPRTHRNITSLPPLAFLEKESMAGSLIAAYEARKREIGAMEFSDQVAFAGQVVAVEGSSAAAAERAAFRAVLLDEFQDTSVLQIDFLSSLFRDAPVMAVGDPNQAIYGWRGASAGALPAFLRGFPGPSKRPRVMSLSVARRNDKSILAAANRISQPLRARLASTLGKALGDGSEFSLPELLPREGTGEGRVEACYFETDREEAAAVADYLRGELCGVPGTGNTAAVLVRKRDQVPALARALEAAGVPYQLATGASLLDVPEVRDLVSALRASQDLTRGDSFMRLASSPRFALGAADLDALAKLARRSGSVDSPLTSLDALDELSRRDARSGAGLSGAGADRLRLLGRALRRIRRASAYLGLAELVLAAERELNLDLDLMAKAGAAGRANIDRLVSEAQAYASGVTGGGLEGFLDWLEAEEDQGQGLTVGVAEARAGEAQILTVHGAKGLEWDVVVVPGMSEGTITSVAPNKAGERLALGWLSAPKGGGGELPWPLRLDRADLPVFRYEEAANRGELKVNLDDFREDAADHSLAEDRRLVYVALTRAKSRLLLTGAWQVREGKRLRPPSVFLDELAGRVGDGKPLVSDTGWAPDPAGGESAAGVEGGAAPDGIGQDGAGTDSAGPPGAGTDSAGQSVDSQEPEVPVWPLPNPLGERADMLRAAADAVAEAGRELGLGDGGKLDLARALELLRGIGGDLAFDAALLLEEPERPDRLPSVALPPRASATALIALAQDRAREARNLRRPIPRPPSRGATIGEQFHAQAALELAHRAGAVGRQGLLEEVDLAVNPPDAELEAEVQDLMAAWRKSRWLTGDYRVQAVEAPVELEFLGHAAAARIDAVFVDRSGGLHVVDWKTDRSLKGAARPEHESQVRFYQAALGRRLGVDPSGIKGYVHYVRENLAVPVEYEAGFLARLEAAVA
jgi:DNA helicase-2/ATP-dependent DNA helicase PcrA